MKKLRLISGVVCLIMLCSVLTGCMGIGQSAIIKENGNGTYIAYFGVGEKLFKELRAEGNPVLHQITFDTSKSFKLDGITYRGETLKEDFSNIDELNELLKSGISKIRGEECPYNHFRVVDNKDGRYYIVVDKDAFAKEVPFDEMIKINVENLSLSDGTEEDMQKIIDSATLFVDIEFPFELKDSNTSMYGAYRDGNKVHIDLVEMSNAFQNESGSFIVWAEPKDWVGEDAVKDSKPESSLKVMKFRDVNKNDWFYNPIKFLFENNVVSGVDDKTFEPNSELTYAQYCQMIYNTMGIETLMAPSYWAYFPIETCIKNGFIEDRGNISPGNYDEPITREAAIAGMYRVINSEYNFGKPIEEYTSRKELISNAVNAPKNSTALHSVPVKDAVFNIPDLSEISPEYKDEIIKAYDIGLTSGMDDKGTFSPKSYLTRAQMCQLFYNIMK